MISCPALAAVVFTALAIPVAADEKPLRPRESPPPAAQTESPSPDKPASPGAKDQTGAEKTRRPVAATIIPADKKDGKIGNVEVTYEDGSKDRWTTKGNATLPRVSANGTVGWAVVEPPVKPPGLSYELRPCRRITVCRRGTVIATIPSALSFIEEWRFVEGQLLHLAVKSRQSHGPAKIQLIALPGGKVVATVNAFDKDLPPWARGLGD